MKRIPSGIKWTIVCAVLFGVLAACNGPSGGRNSNSLISPRQPASTLAAQPPAASATAVTAPLPVDKSASSLSAPQVAPRAASAPATHIDQQSSAQADEIDRALDDLTNQLNSVDTLNDLK